MKKILFIAALVSIFNSQFSTCKAQWEFGAKVGAGYASITDDLATKSPIFGATVGGFANLTFAKSESILAEIFYLQTGLNLNRRGSNFRVVMDRDNTLSIREGFYHAYYAQIPILAGMHMEMPIRKAGHVVGVFLGPTVNVGIFGRCKDRMVSPGISSYTVNYDLDLHGSAHDRAVFSHLRRIDISAILGVSYEYGPFVVNLYVDHGFVATSEETDIIRIIENGQNGTTNSSIKVEIPNGYNTAYMLTVGYKF
ncbi:MAG: PorT family protein [Bacteroidales bacterium]|nr:PorT family protein [Bacteroidales bacterium]